MKTAYSKEWICTDPDTKQYGRQLTDVLFQFKEEGKDETVIDLTGFTNGEIEGVINSYGYTLYKSEEHSHNIYDLYGKQANWIIAECLFEMDM